MNRIDAVTEQQHKQDEESSVAFFRSFNPEVIEKSNSKVVVALKHSWQIYSIARDGGTTKPCLTDVLDETAGYLSRFKGTVTHRRCLDNLYYTGEPMEYDTHELDALADKLSYESIQEWFALAIVRVKNAR